MEIFRTVHGSHLYGLNHANSDSDVFIVTDSERTRMRQSVNPETGIDSARVGWKLFLELAAGGSHQSCEALFSPYKVWTAEGEAYRPLIEGMVVTGSDVFVKYERTIKRFSYGNFKRRRHGARLALNLAVLREYGRFNPVLTETEKRAVNLLAEYSGSALVTWLLRQNYATKISQDWGRYEHN